MAGLGKSGVLRPYPPGRLLRASRVLAGPVTLGSAYRLAAALDPDRAAAVDDAGVATFAEMAQEADALAAGLGAVGIGEGDRVAVLCRNHRGYLLTLVALGRIGADVVHLNTGFAGPQLAGVLADERVRAVVADEEFLAHLDGAALEVPPVVAWSDGPGGDGPSLRGLITDPPAGPPASRRVGRQVLLTSGTTGRPKGAARGAPRDPTAGLAVLSRLPYRRGETAVLAAPVFHAWGLANTLAGLLLGWTLVLPRRFDPEDTLARIARYRAGLLVAVPVMLQRILELPEEVRARHDTSSLRMVALSGSALPGDLALRWMDAFGDHLHSLYGSTEAGWVAVAGPAELRRAPNAAGRLVPGVQVRVLDDDGHPVADGQPGRLFVRSGLAFEGYTDGRDKERLGAFVATGDVGHLADGLLWVDGRDDDMIVSGGENVFPREVEDLLAAHPAVSDVAVVGVGDDRFGQRLEAWVVLRPGAAVTPAELADHVRSHLARHKVPRSVHVLDALPRNSTGKVLTRVLRGEGGTGLS